MEQQPNEKIIVNLSFRFTLNVIKYTDSLEVLRKYVLAKQCSNLEHVLVQTLEKLSTQKVGRTLFTS